MLGHPRTRLLVAISIASLASHHETKVDRGCEMITIENSSLNAVTSENKLTYPLERRVGRRRGRSIRLRRRMFGSRPFVLNSKAGYDRSIS